MIDVSRPHVDTHHLTTPSIHISIAGFQKPCQNYKCKPSSDAEITARDPHSELRGHLNPKDDTHKIPDKENEREI